MNCERGAWVARTWKRSRSPRRANLVRTSFEPGSRARALRDGEAALHEGRVRIAHERVLALLQRQRPCGRAGLAHRRQFVDARTLRMEVVDRRLVGDLEHVLSGLE